MNRNKKELLAVLLGLLLFAALVGFVYLFYWIIVYHPEALLLIFGGLIMWACIEFVRYILFDPLKM